MKCKDTKDEKLIKIIKCLLNLCHYAYIFYSKMSLRQLFVFYIATPKLSLVIIYYFSTMLEGCIGKRLFIEIIALDESS